jgi:hypothetical protein
LARRSGSGPLGITVFEQSDRIGGRLLSVSPEILPGTPMELGGMRYLSNQPLVKGLVEDKLHIGHHPQDVDEPGNISYLRRKILADQMRQVRDGLRAEPNDPQWHAKYRRAIGLAPDVRQQASRLQREFPRGRTYELEIGVPRDSLMEYDVPVYAQQPEVLEKMRAVDSTLVDDLIESPDADGAMFYNTLAGGTVLDPPSARGQRRASEMLFGAGIPGHAYRGNADNYVFYPGTEDSIRILRKYGIMAPIAAGAAAGDE